MLFRSGPACYRNGGPLTVTDCNVLLGRIQPEYFPRVFGAAGSAALDAATVREQFSALAATINAASGDTRTPEQVAAGFIEIAVSNMANAIRQISVQRGHDVTAYTLACFGGAGGQHACLVADALGMTRVLIHPLAGVLSAYGMGLADITAMRELSVEVEFNDANAHRLDDLLVDLAVAARNEVLAQNVPPARIRVVARVHLRYEGTDTALVVPFVETQATLKAFEQAYRARYSFLMPGRALIAEAISVEAIGSTETVGAVASIGNAAPVVDTAAALPAPAATVAMYSDEQ